MTQAMLDIGITMDQQVRLGGGELARGSVIKIASHGQQIAASCQQQVQHVSRPWQPTRCCINCLDRPQPRQPPDGAVCAAVWHAVAG